jgi:hypothetical protein
MGSDLVLVTGASGYVAGHCILRLLTTVEYSAATQREPWSLIWGGSRTTQKPGMTHGRKKLRWAGARQRR